MTNSLLSPSTLAFALPDYAHLSDADYREAIEQGMTEHLAELDVIATDDSPATVSNVLEAWERSGALLNRAMNAFWVAKSADTNDARDAIEEDMAPRLAQHSDAILLDARLVRAASRRWPPGVTPARSPSTSRRRTCSPNGSRTSSAAASPCPRTSSPGCASSTPSWRPCPPASTRCWWPGATPPPSWSPTSPSSTASTTGQKAGAREAAHAAGHDGWLLTITNTTGQPVLAVAHPSPDPRACLPCQRRAWPGHPRRPGLRLRRQLRHRLRLRHDTREVLLTMAHLRHERALLLGYPHHAAYAAEDGCAGSTEAVNEILGRLGPAAYGLVRARGKQLQAHLDATEPGATLEPWDWAYVDGQLRREDAELDPGALRPYLEFDRVLTEGVFAAATALYGITFHRREDLVGYTDVARVYEVREEDGSHLGVAVIDPYTRPTKQGGAWMTSIVDQSHLLDDAPVVTNTCNFPPPAPGRPEPVVVGQRDHALPRVRPRPARAAVRRPLPVPLGDGGAARLRGVPQPGQRDLGLRAHAARAGTPSTTRPVSRCRPTGWRSCSARPARRPTGTPSC